MYSLIVFGVLTLIEFLFIWSKWSDIKDYQEMGKGVADFTGASKKKVYTKSVTMIGNVLANFKKLLLIPLGILLFINLLVSIVLGSIISLIAYIF